jgi:hypothetical protein
LRQLSSWIRLSQSEGSGEAAGKPPTSEELRAPDQCAVALYDRGLRNGAEIGVRNVERSSGGSGASGRRSRNTPVSHHGGGSGERPMATSPDRNVTAFPPALGSLLKRQLRPLQQNKIAITQAMSKWGEHHEIEEMKQLQPATSPTSAQSLAVGHTVLRNEVVAWHGATSCSPPGRGGFTSFRSWRMILVDNSRRPPCRLSAPV